jgi:excisionase family DNA binding protein
MTERLTAREPAAAEPLLDAKQAGALLNVPASWVLAEARVDRIPHVRFGRYVRFDRDELERWWRARLRGPRMDRRNGGPAAQPRPGP